MNLVVYGLIVTTAVGFWPFGAANGLFVFVFVFVLLVSRILASLLPCEKKGREKIRKKTIAMGKLVKRSHRRGFW